MDSPPRPANPRLYLWPMFLFALSLRLAVVWVTARSHSADWFFGQATELARLAESLRTGHGLSSPFGGSTGPSAFLSPAYPAIVAAIFAIFRPYSYASFVALTSLQAVFGAATVWVLMLMTRRVFGNSAANLAGVIWAICPPALWLPILFWETSLSILLATSVVSLSLYCVDNSTRRVWVFTGSFAAFALAVNPSLLPIIVCCMGWAIYQCRSHSFSAPAMGVLVCVLLSTPWAIRNFEQLHAFIPLRSNMGYELWQGNRPGSDGFFAPEFHPNVNSAEFARYQALGEVDYMREKSAVAKGIILADPAKFMTLTIRRAFYFWTGIVRHSAALVVAYIVATSTLGFAGLVLLWRRNRPLALFFLLPLLLFPAPYYITHPDFRFRLVIDPILTALTACLFTRRNYSN